MNFREMELSHLIMLWQSSDGNLPLKALIETELQRRIQDNRNFSREYFFDICKVKNHAINVSFIPTSNAYKLYGPNLTIDIILSEEENQEMLESYSSNPSINTTGIIKAKILIKDNLTNEQIENAKNIGFHTSEVFETLHV